MLTASGSWRAISVLSSAASAGSTGSNRHQFCSGSSAKIFWQKLNAHDSALPEAVSTHAAWTGFHQNLCVTPATPIQTIRPQPAQAALPVDGLEAAITQAEVEKALSKRSNGKATGRMGWPAELLRHAAYNVTLDNGRKVKIWLLAPILASSLARFTQVRLPACASSALVIPTHKKGPQVILPIIGPLQLGSRCTSCTPSSSMTGWWPGLRSMACATQFRLASARQSPLHHLRDEALRLASLH